MTPALPRPTRARRRELHARRPGCTRAPPKPCNPPRTLGAPPPMPARRRGRQVTGACSRGAPRRGAHGRRRHERSVTRPAAPGGCKPPVSSPRSCGVPLCTLPPGRTFPPPPGSQAGPGAAAGGRMHPVRLPSPLRPRTPQPLLLVPLRRWHQPSPYQPVAPMRPVRSATRRRGLASPPMGPLAALWCRPPPVRAAQRRGYRRTQRTIV